jgi:hypothetical protein
MIWPQSVFPYHKLQHACLSENIYIKLFYKKHPIHFSLFLCLPEKAWAERVSFSTRLRTSETKVKMLWALLKCWWTSEQLWMQLLKFVDMIASSSYDLWRLNKLRWLCKALHTVLGRASLISECQLLYFLPIFFVIFINVDFILG